MRVCVCVQNEPNSPLEPVDPHLMVLLHFHVLQIVVERQVALAARVGQQEGLRGSRNVSFDASVGASIPGQEGPVSTAA